MTYEEAGMLADMEARAEVEPTDGPAEADPVRVRVLREAMRLTAADRNATYGDPTENHEQIARIFTAITGIEVTAQDVVMMHIATKLARTRTAPQREDNMVDAAAYAAIWFEIGEMQRARFGSDARVPEIGRAPVAWWENGAPVTVEGLDPTPVRRTIPTGEGWPDGYVDATTRADERGIDKDEAAFDEKQAILQRNAAREAAQNQSSYARIMAGAKKKGEAL